MNLSKTSKSTEEQVVSAVFKNGVLKPLSNLQLPEGKKLTLIIRPEHDSVAKRMYGLCNPKEHPDIDAIIDSEDWLG